MTLHAAVLAALGAMALPPPQGKRATLLVAGTAETQPPLESMPVHMPAPAEPARLAQPPKSSLAFRSPIADAMGPAAALEKAAGGQPPTLRTDTGLRLPASANRLLQPIRSTQARTAFFGVAAAGHRFCYLIDTSRSMRGGRFERARAEVLASVGRLKPPARFYVFCFNRRVEAMQLQENQPAARPARATPEHLRQLARWLSQRRLESGGDPTPALKAALLLRPDVLFLLTDGEFGPEAARFLRETRGKRDRDAQTVVHTIGLHSRRGGARLAELARENGGVYRFVPNGRR